MTRRRRVALIVGPAGLALVALLGSAAGVFDRPAVPTERVRRQRFVHNVGAEGVLRAVQATPIVAPTEGDEPLKIAWLAADGSRVKAQEALVRFDPTALEQDLANGNSDKATALQRIGKAQAQGEVTERNLDRDAGLADRELANARTFQGKDALIYSRFDIIGSEIDVDLAQKRKTHAEAVKGVRGRLEKTDVDLLEIERRKADIQISKAEHALKALELAAPHDGIVVFRRDWRGNVARVGETVWPGQKLAEIPRLDNMEAEVYVLETDAGGLAVGLGSRVSVEGSAAGPVAGKVKQVDALAKTRFRNVPVQYFGAILELERTDPATMKPGQRVQATLVIAEEDHALVIPRQAVFEQGGGRVVYRKTVWGGFRPVEVTLGATALGRVVVNRGLAEGDVIALVDPTKPPAVATPVAGSAPRAGMPS